MASGHHQVVLNQQLLQLDWKPPAVREWQLDARFWVEHENALEPSTTNEMTVLELTLRRETATQALTLGRQIIVWGKADGFRLLDVVHPLDLREFVLGDTVRQRIPLWMANVQFFPDEDQQVQLLLIPQTCHDRLPDPGGEFDPTASLPPGTEVLPLQKPSNRPEKWSYGLRWKYHLGELGYQSDGIAQPHRCTRHVPPLEREDFFGRFADHDRIVAEAKLFL